MDPKIIQFMYVNGFVVLLLVIYMVFWRTKRDPSRLKLRERLDRHKLDIKSGKSQAYRDSPQGQVHKHNVDFKNAPEHEYRTERVLNVIFQFNGHDFDAYEVLGVAAGSAVEVVEKSYSQLLQTSDEDSREFLQMAFNAIKRKIEQG